MTRGVVKTWIVITHISLVLAVLSCVSVVALAPIFPTRVFLTLAVVEAGIFVAR